MCILRIINYVTQKHQIKTYKNNIITVLFGVRLAAFTYTIQRTQTYTKSHRQQARCDAVVAYALLFSTNRLSELKTIQGKRYFTITI